MRYNFCTLSEEKDRISILRNKHPPTHTHKYTHIYSHTRTHSQIHTHIFAHPHTLTNTHTHIRTRTHLHKRHNSTKSETIQQSYIFFVDLWKALQTVRTKSASFSIEIIWSSMMSSIFTFNASINWIIMCEISFLFFRYSPRLIQIEWRFRNFEFFMIFGIHFIFVRLDILLFIFKTNISQCWLTKY